MNIDNDTAQHSNDNPLRRQRRKRKNYTDHAYGARLPPEDARIIDDYGKHNRLDRSEVVRLGMHQFALRQQMKYKAPDPFREAHEHLIKIYLKPLCERVEHLATQISEPLPSNGNDAQPNDNNISAEGFSAAELDRHLREHRQLLEQILVVSTLLMRLHINYTIEPQLRLLDASETEKLEEHFQAAETGKEHWSAATREVVKRTGNCILDELNLLIKAGQ